MIFDGSEGCQLKDCKSQINSGWYVMDDVGGLTDWMDDVGGQAVNWLQARVNQSLGNKWESGRALGVVWKRSKQIRSNWQIQAAIFIGTKRTKMFANCSLSERNFDPVIGIDYAFHLKKYISRLWRCLISGITGSKDEAVFIGVGMDTCVLM